MNITLKAKYLAKHLGMYNIFYIWHAVQQFRISKGSSNNIKMKEHFKKSHTFKTTFKWFWKHNHFIQVYSAIRLGLDNNSLSVIFYAY